LLSEERNMMAGIQGIKGKPACGWLKAPPAPQICAACIQASGGSLGNIERIMTGSHGDAVGVKLRNAADVDEWMKSLGEGRCPCLHVVPAFRPAPELPREPCAD